MLSSVSLRHGAMIASFFVYSQCVQLKFYLLLSTSSSGWGPQHTYVVIKLVFNIRLSLKPYTASFVQQDAPAGSVQCKLESMHISCHPHVDHHLILMLD